MVMRKEGLGSLLPPPMPIRPGGPGRPGRPIPPREGPRPPIVEPGRPGGPRPPGISLADKIRKLQMQKQRLAEQSRRIEIQLQQLMSGGERPPWDIEPPRPRPFPGNGDMSPVGPVMPTPTPVGPITPIGPGTPQPPPPSPWKTDPPWGG